MTHLDSGYDTSIVKIHNLHLERLIRIFDLFISPEVTESVYKRRLAIQ
jgi:hypothetical protein